MHVLSGSCQVDHGPDTEGWSGGRSLGEDRSLYRYAQHCPVARAAEVVTQPWTLLVLRELLCGNELRADIAEGVPRMSQSLLTSRLRTLVTQGLVVEVPDSRPGKRYRLTA